MRRLLGRLDPFVAAGPVDAGHGDRIHGAGLGALEAVLAPLVQAGLGLADERVVAEIGFGDQAPQPSGAPLGRDELGVDAEAAQP